ncbi:MAG TPA: hypothetical protein VGR27_10075, partial [Longimicrobiaceae bacterium]|nr:hypothetical protein [Longimicrobiaceae bacterium]
PALGEFRADFGGMLGTIEERPSAGPDGEPGFAGALDVVDTDQLLKRFERDPGQRVDTRAYLTARLLDLLVGDWDRHPDQWRWALMPREGSAHWLPIPRDRDQAMVRYDGLLLHVARQQYPKVVLFGPRYGNLYGMTESSIELDRRLLAELRRPAWDSTVTVIQQALTDPVIEDAVRRMPPEFYQRTGEDLSRTLKARRDRLPDAARWLYGSVNTEADVHASDQGDLAVAERQQGGRLAVSLYRRGSDGQPHGEPYFHRVFDRRETREVRLMLYGGQDRALVRGDARQAPRVRVVGGGGSDELVDSTRVASGAVNTVFYDARGENRLVTGPGTAVDTRPYTPPVYERSRIRDRHRDWGTRQFITPWLEYSSEYGVVIGGGPTLYRYGFRQVPFASRISLRAAYATGAEAGALEFNGQFYRANSSTNLSVLARVSGVELARFYGFGNDAPATQPDVFYRVRQRQALIEPILNLAPARHLRLSVGPVIQHSDTYHEANTFIGETRPYGSGSFGQVGLRSGVAFDTRNRAAAATRGMRLEVGG